jgi:hypothetical protein
MANPEIDAVGNKFWYKSGCPSKRHRIDGPAIEWADSGKSWYINNNIHRTDGPAVEWPTGGLWWYLNGEKYKFDQWLELNPDLTDSEKVMMKLQYG